MGTDLNYFTRSTRSALSRESARLDAFALKACIDSLQTHLAEVEALAACYRAEFETMGNGEIPEL